MVVAPCAVWANVWSAFGFAPLVGMCMVFSTTLCKAERTGMLFPVRAVWQMFAAAVSVVLMGLLAGSAFAAIPAVPYSMDAELYRLDTGGDSPAPGGMRVGLGITLTPQQGGVYLYASTSQTKGKPTEIGVWSLAGELVASSALFPEGTPGSDPLTPGAVGSFFYGPISVFVPLDARFGGKTVRVYAEGLACSTANCTPLTLEREFFVPPVETWKTLPFPVQPLLRVFERGVREKTLAPVLAEPFALSSTPVFGVTHNAFEGASGTPSMEAVPMAGFSPDSLTPVALVPELEVASLGKAILFGFLAGLLLNFMPCVLPVLGIKLSALAHGNGGEEGVRAFRRYQLLFALGVLAWFFMLAVALASLGLVWGQIFQSQAVVLTLAVFLLVLALNLFGVLTLPLIDLRAESVKHSDAKAFMGGFTATLLATPCGGPLLGGVLSWALLQPPVVLGMAVGCVGLGMASPYCALALFPGLASRMPKPGPWMHTLEQVLGFLLLGAVAYLVSLLPVGMLPRTLFALVGAAFGAWLWGRGARLGRTAGIMTRVCAVVVLVCACVWPLSPRERDVVWNTYTPAGFAELLGTRPILVDFTADWCPTCKVLESTTLGDSNVAAWQKRYNAALFRVDLTRKNPEGEALLRAVGSISIPVLAVFPEGDAAHSPYVLRDIVTSGQVEKALGAATKR